MILHNRKRFFLISGVLVVILLALFIILKTMTQTKMIEIKNLVEMPGKIENGNPTLIDNSYLFSNGRSIVSYDLATGETIRYGDETENLPRIDAIVPETSSLNYIAYRTSLLPPNSSQQNIESLQPPFWWIASKDNSAPRKIIDNSETIQWENQTSIIFSSGKTIKKMSLLDSSTSSLLENINISAIKSFHSYGNSIDYNSYNNTFWEFKNNINSELGQDINFVLYNKNVPDCRVLYKLTPGENSEQLFSGCKKLDGIRIEENSTSIIFTDNGDGVIYAANSDNGNQKLYYYDIGTGQKSYIELVGNYDMRDIEIVSAKSLDRILLRIGKKFYVSNPEITPEKINSSISEKISDITIDISPSTQTVSVSRTGSFSKEDKVAVYNFLKNNSINPDLYTINFITLTGDNYRWD